MDRYACLYLLRSAQWGVARIKDSVEVDSSLIHPLPPTSTTPPTSPVGECNAIRSLQNEDTPYLKLNVDAVHARMKYGYN